MVETPLQLLFCKAHTISALENKRIVCRRNKRRSQSNIQHYYELTCVADQLIFSDFV